LFLYWFFHLLFILALTLILFLTCSRIPTYNVVEIRLSQFRRLVVFFKRKMEELKEFLSIPLSKSVVIILLSLLKILVVMTRRKLSPRATNQVLRSVAKERVSGIYPLLSVLSLHLSTHSTLYSPPSYFFPTVNVAKELTFGCCDSKSYDTAEELCCKGKIFDVADYVDTAYCCAGKPYDSLNEFCCGKKIYQVGLLLFFLFLFHTTSFPSSSFLSPKTLRPFFHPKESGLWYSWLLW
jgi:hypothetical protein